MKNISLNVSAANHILIEEEELDSALNSCLAVLGESLKACRSYIYTIENESVRESYSWINPELKKNDAPLFDYLCKSIPEIITPLRKGFHLVGFTNEIKEPFFKQIMFERKVETYLFIPIFENDIFWGFLSFEHCYAAQWDSEIIELIKLFTKNISIKINEIRYKKNIGPSFDIFNYYDQGSFEGIWELDINTNEAKMSNNWARILGFSIFEVEQNYEFWRSRVHSDDLVRVEKQLQEYILGKLDECFGKYRIKNKKGKFIWLQYSGTIKRNKKGKPLKIIGTIVDINEIETNKIALEESEKKLRFILENSSDLITQRDIKGNYTYISESSKEILGYTPQELMELNLDYELFHPDDFENVLTERSNFINDRDSIRNIFNVRVKKKDGNYIWMEVVSKKIEVNNTLISIQSTARDITLRKNLEKQNEKAIKREKELYDLKANFIAMASHQFKTPLTVIYSNAELIGIKSKSIENKIAKNFNTISNRIKFEIERMSELIDNILVFGKYSAKENFRLKIEAIDFDEFIANLIVTYFNHEADGREVKVVTIGSSKPVQSDTSLLIHIFTNLLNNAFKYSKGKPNPVLKIGYLKENIQIEVIDYGIGIPDQDIKNLFKSFFRASNTTTIVGSGLGLTIVKQFTRMLKGKIKLKTKQNSGTKITITFPYEQK
ncbi:PAS domain S-box protein [Flavobacterium nitratireducens]|uniref:sensor histidine kinase n=1 Tax=Flavobacterium nitratireducens TaxID=992289 RepID=UPI0024150D58|nr:PAS domain S-box protein [Flavobacterium nitratireducens]